METDFDSHVLPCQEEVCKGIFPQSLSSPVALPPAISARRGAGLSEGKHWQLSGCWQS